MKPDARDIVASIGLTAATVGAWMIYPPAALLLFGFTFMALAFFYEA